MLPLHEVRIVADSSADALSLAAVATASAPLCVATEQTEYVDTPALDVHAMITALATYHGKTRTSCPSMASYLDAFGDAKYVFCITITAKLSASYAVACSAARAYEEEHPDRRVYVIDSRNTGPGMRLIAEKVEELLLAGKDFDEICKEADAYREQTELLFLLESLHNLANNGRVNRAVAKIAGLLGIRMLGRAVEGEISPVAKPRGAGRALVEAVEQMLALGYKGGKLRVSHCENEQAAADLVALLREKFPELSVKVQETGALCSYYAERGGLLVGFECEK